MSGLRTYKKNDFDYSTIASVLVDMRPVDVRPGPLKAGGRRSSNANVVTRAADIVCVHCMQIVSSSPHILCTECKRVEIRLCFDCFELGAEIGEHIRGHNYEVALRCGPPVFIAEPNEGENWGAFEDQRLLSLIRTYKLEEWPKVALAEFGRKRSVQEALNHFSACFMRNVFSEVAMEGMLRPPIHVFGLREPEIYSGEFFRATGGDELRRQLREIGDLIPDGHRLLDEVDCCEPAAVRPTKAAEEADDRLEAMVCELSHVHVEHNPALLAEMVGGERRCFLHNRFTYLNKQKKEKKKAEDVKALCLEHLNRTPPSRHKQAAEEGEDPPNVCPARRVCDDHNVEAEEQSIAGSLFEGDMEMKEEARSEAEESNQETPSRRNRTGGRGRRKRKLGEEAAAISEESNKSPNRAVASKMNGPHHKADEYLTKEEALSHRLQSPHLHFASKEPPLMNKQRGGRFDADDLNLVAYNPKRDDFEHEYRNAAENFISKIFLNGENLNFSEVESFKTAIRLAKVQRYNRVLERRRNNHAIIREHNLLDEFFSIVKTNVNERGKYALFAADSFPSMKRAEECRPYFAKLRRVLGKTELSELAENVAEMESCMAQIKELQALQRAGVTELPARLKGDISSPSKGRKRRTRKAEGELRKAGLRWERIKRWNKRVNEAS